MLQAWFDDTGKDGRSPIFMLAGVVAPVRNWAAFADSWDNALKGKPRPLEYFKAYEAHWRCGQFKGWTQLERDHKVSELTAIIEQYVCWPGAGAGVTFSVQHDDYDSIVVPCLSPENRKLRHHRRPFDLAFVATIGAMLQEAYTRPTRQLLHLLFDEGIETKEILKNSYLRFVDYLTRERPKHIDLLHNKDAEFRDDKHEPPLQAADLFAWHARRYLESQMRGADYIDSIWLRLNAALVPKDYSYSRADLRDFINTAIRMQDDELNRIAKSPDPIEALRRYKKS
jgi:hypothetical protein